MWQEANKIGKSRPKVRLTIFQILFPRNMFKGFIKMNLITFFYKIELKICLLKCKILQIDSCSDLTLFYLLLYLKNY